MRKRFGLECCGTEHRGRVYNTRLQICCTFGSAVNVRRLNGRDLACCGSRIYNRDNFDNAGCCIGPQGQPQIFNVLTEMCCAGVVNFAGTFSTYQV